MSDQQHAINLLRAQYQQSQQWFEGTMQGVTDEVAHYQPAGKTIPIAGQAVHIVTGLDFFLLGAVAKKAPLFTSSFAGKAGVSEPPPEGGDWTDWGRTVKVQVPALLAYGQAVFSAVDDYLASLDDEALENKIELGSFGVMTLSAVFGIMLLNTYSHVGEISCIKGLQGLQGYPM